MLCLRITKGPDDKSSYSRSREGVGLGGQISNRQSCMLRLPKQLSAYVVCGTHGGLWLSALQRFSFTKPQWLPHQPTLHPLLPLCCSTVNHTRLRNLAKWSIETWQRKLSTLAQSRDKHIYIDSHTHTLTHTGWHTHDTCFGAL